MGANEKIIATFKKLLEEDRFAAATIKAYCADLTQLSLNINNSFTNVTEAQISGFIKSLLNNGLTRKTLSRKLNSLNKFFKFMVDKGYRDINPCSYIEYPKPEIRLPKFLKASEYKTILNAASSNDKVYTIITLALKAGLKINEISNLKWKDCTLGADPSITINKAKSSRVIPLTKTAYFVVKAFREDTNTPSAYVFATQNKNKIHVRNIRSMVNRVFVKCGLENYSLNDLRNTFIVNQLNAGNSIEFVAKVSGHTSTKTTERYLLVMPKPYKFKGKNLIVD